MARRRSFNSGIDRSLGPRRFCQWRLGPPAECGAFINAIRAILQETVGLFVDDGALAIAVVLIVGIVTMLDAVNLVHGAPLGVLLVVGAVAALSMSVLRARRP